jgi:hypothetical protein
MQAVKSHASIAPQTGTFGQASALGRALPPVDVSIVTALDHLSLTELDRRIADQSRILIQSAQLANLPDKGQRIRTFLAD